MAEKGGNGSSVPSQAVKYSLKSATSNRASAKGKDDSSGKPKKARKVQFVSEGLGDGIFGFSSGGKVDSLLNKLNLGKGGKGDKTGKAAKSSAPKELLPLELRFEHELPKHAKCLMDCEATEILQGIQEQMVILSEDPTIKIPVSFDCGLQYAKNGIHYADRASVRRALEPLTQYGVTEGEICVIGNVCPETPDEVFALVPSLKAKKSKLAEPLKDVLAELVKLKKAT
ncbi:DNA-directed RNA polymerases IV and V subunit 4-like [Syzygium oleosum]|uniref:DNA-directed RNA polymerases IV and V subunit 4-like n=1 Tax=Syzygium oleosum TaxID=219896 RepID=UPI0024BB1FD3|nr:DNA-directed RNA polymerases IV and V subunit 4-like [Syzygium oleosum]